MKFHRTYLSIRYSYFEGLGPTVLLKAVLCCFVSQLAQVGEPYFIVEFDEGGSLFMRIKGRFPLQFGR